MTVSTGRSPESGVETAPTEGEGRLGEERARQILERAAALDAKRSSEVDIAQLREAAEAAGISVEAFEQALREAGGSGSTSAASLEPEAFGSGGLSSAQVAHCTGLLRDLLGEDARVTVLPDRIEARDNDGVIVSLNASTGEASAAVAAFGRFRDRLLVLYGPALIPLFMGFILTFEEEDAGIGMMLGVLLTLVATLAGGAIQHRKERKKLSKKAEKIRRQLQRMLAPGSETP